MIIVSKEPCILNDLDEVVEIDRLCFEEDFRYDSRIYKKLIESVDVSSLKLTEKGKIVGYIFWKLNHIITINIHPKHRRKGHAQILINMFENYVKNNPVIFFHVFEKNEASINLYKKLGYIEKRIEKDYYGNGLHAIYFEKQCI